MISTLIDKQDNFEIVRDQIAAILALEVNNQMVLATAVSKNPNDWKLRIFSERSNAFEEFLNVDINTDVSPLVNVWFDNSSFDKKSSNIMERQKCTAIYNIDCFGYGTASDNAAGGHHVADKAASLEVQKAIRLVRNILMSDIYVYLGLTRGTAWDRFIDSITVFQPQINNQAAQNIVGARIAFSVSFNEFSPQITPETLELLSAAVSRAEDGSVVVNTDYSYPL